MARPRSPNEPSTYQERPEIPPEIRRRFDLVRAILAERISISDAARELAIARVNMQTIVHRAEAAIVTALMPRPSGPSPKPDSEKALEARVKELEQKNAKLAEQLQAADDMMGAAGEIIRSLRGLPPKNSASRSPRTRTATRASSSRSRAGSPSGTAGSSAKTSSTESPPEPEDPEPALESSLQRAAARLTASRSSARRAARALGVDVTTLRRWLARLAQGEPLRRRRGGVRAPVAEAVVELVRDRVQALHGLVGASSLAHSIDGVSRRAAAEIKRDTLAEMERARVAACSRVEVTVPGVVRGFDAMHLQDGFALVAADAAVPYRTTIVHVPRYDAAHVVEVVECDFATNGAPLVWRRDRAACQATDEVDAVLKRYGVVALQGPAHYPQYYGQLERQNREHDAWLRVATTVDQESLEAMRIALNREWHRPTLGWRSAEDVWAARPSFDDDRSRFHDDVHERASRLRERVGEDLAMRLAIEQALTQRGLLKVTPRRSVLRE